MVGVQLPSAWPLQVAVMAAVVVVERYSAALLPGAVTAGAVVVICSVQLLPVRVMAGAVVGPDLIPGLELGVEEVSPALWGRL